MLVQDGCKKKSKGIHTNQIVLVTPPQDACNKIHMNQIMLVQVGCKKKPRAYTRIKINCAGDTTPRRVANKSKGVPVHESNCAVAIITINTTNCAGGHRPKLVSHSSCQYSRVYRYTRTNLCSWHQMVSQTLITIWMITNGICDGAFQHKLFAIAQNIIMQVWFH